MTLSLVAAPAAQTEHHLHFDPCEILFRIAEIGTGAGGVCMGLLGTLTMGSNVATDLSDPLNLAVDLGVTALGLFTTAKSGSLLVAGLTPAQDEIQCETQAEKSNLKIMPRPASARAQSARLPRAA